MSRTALALAVAALACAVVPAPGLYLAIGLGLAAIGLGWVGFRDRRAPGARRLAGAAALSLGVLGALLGGLRVALTIAAISHLDAMLK